MFFRKECYPKWENFQYGGCWILQRGLKQQELEQIDKEWEKLLLACIGEEFNDINIIGLILATRYKENILEIWLENGREELRVRSGETLRKIINLTQTTINFKNHFKSLKLNCTLKGMETYKFILKSHKKLSNQKNYY